MPFACLLLTPHAHKTIFDCLNVNYHLIHLMPLNTSTHLNSFRKIIYPLCLTSIGWGKLKLKWFFHFRNSFFALRFYDGRKMRKIIFNKKKNVRIFAFTFHLSPVCLCFHNVLYNLIYIVNVLLRWIKRPLMPFNPFFVSFFSLYSWSKKIFPPSTENLTVWARKWRFIRILLVVESPGTGNFTFMQFYCI